MYRLGPRRADAPPVAPSCVPRSPQRRQVQALGVVVAKLGPETLVQASEVVEHPVQLAPHGFEVIPCGVEGRAQELHNRRNLNAVAWARWLKGYPFSRGVRRHLLDVAKRLEGGLRRWEAGDFDAMSATAKRTRQAPIVRAGLRSIVGKQLAPSDLTAIHEVVTGAAPGGRPSRPEDLRRRYDPARSGMPLGVWRAALERAPEQTLNRARDEMLGLQLILDALNGGHETPVTPVSFICWFGLTRANRAGRQILRAFTIAVARGQVPQLVEALRPAIPMVARAIRFYQQLERDPR